MPVTLAEVGRERANSALLPNKINISSGTPALCDNRFVRQVREIEGVPDAADVRGSRRTL